MDKLPKFHSKVAEKVRRDEAFIARKGAEERELLRTFICGFTNKRIASVLQTLSSVEGRLDTPSQIHELNVVLKGSRHPFLKLGDDVRSQTLGKLLTILNLSGTAKKIAREEFKDLDALVVALSETQRKAKEALDKKKKTPEQKKEPEVVKKKLNPDEKLAEFFGTYFTAAAFQKMIGLAEKALDNSVQRINFCRALVEIGYPFEKIQGREEQTPSHYVNELLDTSFFLQKAEYWKMHGTLEGFTSPRISRKGEMPNDVIERLSDIKMAKVSGTDNDEAAAGLPLAEIIVQPIDYTNATGKELVAFLDALDTFRNQNTGASADPIAAFLLAHDVPVSVYEKMRDHRDSYKRNPSIPFSLGERRVVQKIEPKAQRRQPTATEDEQKELEDLLQTIQVPKRGSGTRTFSNDIRLQVVHIVELAEKTGMKDPVRTIAKQLDIGFVAVCQWIRTKALLQLQQEQGKRSYNLGARKEVTR